MSVEVAKVWQTEKYEMFGKSEYQPDTRIKATKDLIDSIKEHNGNIMPIIIDKNTSTVIEGHRRLEACILVGVPVKFIYATEDEGRTIAQINGTGRMWRTKDYISSYSNHSEEYNKLNVWLGLKKINNLEFVHLLFGVTTDMIKAKKNLSINYNQLDSFVRSVEIVKAILDVDAIVPIARAIKRMSKQYNITHLELRDMVIKAEAEHKVVKIKFYSFQKEINNVLESIICGK